MYHSYCCNRNGIKMTCNMFGHGLLLSRCIVWVTQTDLSNRNNQIWNQLFIRRGSEKVNVAFLFRHCHFQSWGWVWVLFFLFFFFLLFLASGFTWKSKQNTNSFWGEKVLTHPVNKYDECLQFEFLMLLGSKMERKRKIDPLLKLVTTNFTWLGEFLLIQQFSDTLVGLLSFNP